MKDHQKDECGRQMYETLLPNIAAYLTLREGAAQIVQELRGQGKRDRE